MGICSSSYFFPRFNIVNQELIRHYSILRELEFKQNNDNIIVSFQKRKIKVVTPRSSTISKLAFIIASLLMATAFITSSDENYCSRTA